MYPNALIGYLEWYIKSCDKSKLRNFKSVNNLNCTRCIRWIFCYEFIYYSTQKITTCWQATTKNCLILHTAITWLIHCRYGVKLYPINQSIILHRFGLLRFALDSTVLMFKGILLLNTKIISWIWRHTLVIFEYNMPCMALMLLL